MAWAFLTAALFYWLIPQMMKFYVAFAVGGGHVQPLFTRIIFGMSEAANTSAGICAFVLLTLILAYSVTRRSVIAWAVEQKDIERLAGTAVISLVLLMYMSIYLPLFN